MRFKLLIKMDVFESYMLKQIINLGTLHKRSRIPSAFFFREKKKSFHKKKSVVERNSL